MTTQRRNPYMRFRFHWWLFNVKHVSAWVFRAIGEARRAELRNEFRRAA